MVTQEDRDAIMVIENYLVALIRNTLRDSGLITSPTTEATLTESREKLLELATDFNP